jgi:hypothetical protein
MIFSVQFEAKPWSDIASTIEATLNESYRGWVKILTRWSSYLVRTWSGVVSLDVVMKLFPREVKSDLQWFCVNTIDDLREFGLSLNMWRE